MDEVSLVFFLAFISITHHTPEMGPLSPFKREVKPVLFFGTVMGLPNPTLSSLPCVDPSTCCCFTPSPSHQREEPGHHHWGERLWWWHGSPAPAKPLAAVPQAVTPAELFRGKVEPLSGCRHLALVEPHELSASSLVQLWLPHSTPKQLRASYTALLMCPSAPRTHCSALA